MFLQILLAGIVLGACYAVVSVGMTTLYQATTVLNFSHGECVMVGAFIFFTLQVTYGLSYPLAIIITILAALLLGALMEKTVFRRLLSAPHVNVVLATNGFLYFLQGRREVHLAVRTQVPSSVSSTSNPSVSWAP